MNVSLPVCTYTCVCHVSEELQLREYGIICGTGGGIFFQASILCSVENAKFWPFLAQLAILLQIYALFGVLFTGLKIMRLRTK